MSVCVESSTETVIVMSLARVLCTLLVTFITSSNHAHICTTKSLFEYVTSRYHACYSEHGDDHARVSCTVCSAINQHVCAWQECTHLAVYFGSACSTLRCTMFPCIGLNDWSPAVLTDSFPLCGFAHSYHMPYTNRK